MPDTIKISELDEALALADAAEFPYSQENGGERTTFKAPLTQIAAKIVEDMSYAGINLPAGAGVKSVENTLNYLLGAIGGDPNGNISDSYDPATAYVKGDLCIYENVLYICTAPTTGTFDPSKWTATTIDNVIGDLTALTTTDKSSLVGAVNEVNGKTTSTNTTVGIGSYGDDIQLCKSGKVVLMIINPLSSLPSGGWTQIGTLPNGYEPIIQVISDMYSRDDRHLRIRLDQDKKIYVYNYSSAISSTNNAYWNITYITA